MGTAATTPAVHAPTPTLAVPSQVVSFPSQDGVALDGVLYGAEGQGNGQGNGGGTHAIILSNEGDNDASKWRPVALQLARQGYLVLSYSYRRGLAPGQSSSQALLDLRGAMAFMQAHHLSALALIGSSLGGLVSLAATTGSERMDAVVAISAPVEWEDVQLSDGQLAGLSVPKLFVISADNQPFTDDTIHMYAVTPAPKQLREYPGRVHGIGLFEGASGTEVWSTLLQFLQTYVAAR